MNTLTLLNFEAVLNRNAPKPLSINKDTLCGRLIIYLHKHGNTSSKDLKRIFNISTSVSSVVGYLMHPPYNLIERINPGSPNTIYKLSDNITLKDFGITETN